MKKEKMPKYKPPVEKSKSDKGDNAKPNKKPC